MSEEKQKCENYNQAKQKSVEVQAGKEELITCLH